MVICTCPLSLFSSALWYGRLPSLHYIHKFPCSLASLWVQQEKGKQKGIQVGAITSLLPPSLAMVWRQLHCSLQVLRSTSFVYHSCLGVVTAPMCQPGIPHHPCWFLLALLNQFLIELIRFQFGCAVYSLLGS